MLKKFNIFEDFISKEALSGVVLFFATILAIITANSSFSEMYFEIWQVPIGLSFGSKNIAMSLAHWINDGLMAVFFLMVGLEIKREMAIGELSSLSKASFPVFAALGGMIFPALIYVAFNLDNPIGFGIPMATDIAFALGILMLLGKKVNPSLKIFLVALAVVDDLGAVLVVATVYTHEIRSEYFIYAGMVYALIWGMNVRGVTKLFPYLIFGVLLWIFIHAIGIHATIAGVLLAFAIPIKAKIDEVEFVNNTRNSIQEFEEQIEDSPILTEHQINSLEGIAYNYEKVQNPLVKLEHRLHGLSAFFIMPVFAFANAGIVIDFSTVSIYIMPVLGVIFGLFLGKPIGILLITFLATKLNLTKKPDDISWFEITGIGFLSGVGFTMSIFITQLAFSDPMLIGSVKLGVFIASAFAALLGGILILKSSKARR